MPMDDLPFDSEEELLTHLQEDMGIDSGKAEEVAEVIIEEAESEEGNPKQLLQSIKDGAKNILTNLGLETVSWVENPSQDSMFVMMKNSEDRVKKSTTIYKNPEEDNWETVYGPVMRPNDIDKDGDLATTADIQKAAHEFMAEGRVEQFDTDHDLNTGKGTMVESWILKEDREYELPNGEMETIREGSWMVGVKPSEEVKERIENGEITGWSIFGQADKVELENQAKFKSFKHGREDSSFKGNNTMGQNPGENNESKEEELSIKDVHSEITALKESFNEFKESPEPATVKSVEELKQHAKSEEKTSLVELGKDFELETAEKEIKAENMSDLMDELEDMLAEEDFSMLVDAVRGDEIEEESDMDEDEEEDEDKTAKAKGSNGEGAREAQNQVNKGESTGDNISFQKVAEKHKQEA